MPEFYTKLKDIRTERGIELDEIHARTKISLRFLKAIEEGNFEILPKPYIRLFLRAYGTEIGLPPEELITKFETFIGDKKSKPVSDTKKKKELKFESEDKSENKMKIVHLKKSPKNNRDKLIKSILLLTVWIFVLFIIHKNINTNAPKELGVHLDNNTTFANPIDLNFIESYSEEHAIEFVPPYSLFIQTDRKLDVFVFSDSIHTSHLTLLSGETKTLKIENKTEFIFEHSLNVMINLLGPTNEIPILPLHNFENPVKVIVSIDPPSYSLHKFSPNPK